MRKLIALALLALAIAGGFTAESAFVSQPAHANGGGGCGRHP
jgi:Spy/CpxP family protein refolding chaperone